jgi:hypothetical protein
MIRDRLGQSTESIHGRYISMNRWICTEGDGYIIWGKGIHGCICRWRCTNFDDFIRINESGIKKLHVSILLL